MRLGLSAAQTTQAAREIRTCLRRAGRPIDAFRLSRDTFAFHLRNRLSSPLDFAERQSYAIRIAERVVDLHMRRGAGDMFVFHEVFTSQSYRLPAPIRARIRTVVDLGSNVGLTALYWLDTLPDVRIVCVEPAPDNAAILRDNLAAFSDRAVSIEAAIAGQSGTALLSEGGASWEHRVVSDGSPGRALDCVSTP